MHGTVQFNFEQINVKTHILNKQSRYIFTLDEELLQNISAELSLIQELLQNTNKRLFSSSWKQNCDQNPAPTFFNYKERRR